MAAGGRDRVVGPGDVARRQVTLSILFIGMLVMAIILFNSAVFPSSARRITYSQFDEMLRAGQIERCEVGSDSIRGTLVEEVDLASGAGQSRVKVKDFVTIRVSDPDLAKKLAWHGVQYSGVAEGNGLLTLMLIWVLPLIVVLGVIFVIMRRMGPQQTALTFGKSRAKVFADKEVKFRFSDVAGIDEAKEELQEIVEFLRDPERFRRLGGRIPRGVLLLGAPGTGKTLLAKAVAGESGVPFFSLSGSDFVEMFAGVGAARVRDLFQQSVRSAPCIVFIDEIDALGKQRGLGMTGAHDEREQTLNQLLSEMDGFDANLGVVIIAATNRPEILDPALLRPGRFDRQVVVDRPDLAGRIAILGVHAKGVKLTDDLDLEVLARRTPGFVGADLANVLNEAALLAARRDKEAVEMTDLEEAVDRTVAGLERKQRVMNPAEKERIAFHEAGHALVALSVEHADPVHRVSIIPRGVAALGYTMQLPTEDRYLLTRQELLDRIAVALGGRAAEDLIFGDLSTGASDDLRRVVEMARRMVKEYGMSERFGAVVFDDQRRPGPFIGGAGDGSPGSYSDETAREIDEEMRALIETAEARVKDIVSEREAVLRATAARLIEREIIEQEELNTIMRDHGLIAPGQENSDPIPDSGSSSGGADV